MTLAKTSAVVLAFAWLLTACGFTLRGEFQLADHLSPVYLQPSSAVDLRGDLRTLLKANNVVLAADSGSAASTLKIDFDRRTQRVISVDGRGRVREYELNYAVQYTLEYGDDKSMQRTINLSRDMLFDPDSVLAIRDETATLYEDMMQDAVRIIMQQLRAVK